MKDKIKSVISDTVLDLTYYDRKEDEELGVGDIEAAIKRGDISINEMTEWFRRELVASTGVEDE